MDAGCQQHARRGHGAPARGHAGRSPGAGRYRRGEGIDPLDTYDKRRPWSRNGRLRGAFDPFAVALAGWMACGDMVGMDWPRVVGVHGMHRMEASRLSTPSANWFPAGRGCGRLDDGHCRIPSRKPLTRPEPIGRCSIRPHAKPAWTGRGMPCVSARAERRNRHAVGVQAATADGLQSGSVRLLLFGKGCCGAGLQQGEGRMARVSGGGAARGVPAAQRQWDPDLRVRLGFGRARLFGTKVPVGGLRLPVRFRVLQGRP